MNLEKELNLFSSFVGKETSHCRISNAGPFILHLQSKSTTKSNITLGFLALVHGNEFLGLPILNSFLKLILTGELELHSDMYLALGNIPAALDNRRFIDEDLNRSFGKSDDQTIESRRARELESSMLNHCDFLIDLHQTISPAESPFFIFQYSSEQCLSFIKNWNPGIPTILQHDQIGENTGLSTDEYLRSRKKFGVALELGQLGNSEHFNLGLGICKKALDVKTLFKSKSISDEFKFPLLQLSGSYKVKNSSYQLDEGWKNLSPIIAGEKLGHFDKGIIRAPVTGHMLFPRYRQLSAGQDLFSYCTSYPVKSNLVVAYQSHDITSLYSKNSV